MYLGLQVKMVKTTSKGQVQQLMCGHRQSYQDMRNYREYMFLELSRHAYEHNYFGRMMAEHEKFCPDMKGGLGMKP